jgi:hypothetical protein
MHLDSPLLAISLASSDDVRRQATSEVGRHETVQPRTGRIQPRGLFCELIFGRQRDWECACGLRRGGEQAGTVCPRCGSRVAHLRSTRLGCIELAGVAALPLFEPALARLFNFTPEALRQVLGYIHYCVVDPGEAPFRAGRLLSEEEYRLVRDQYGQSVEVEMGGEACRRLLARQSLLGLAARLRQRLASGPRWRLRQHLLRRLREVDRWCRAAPHDPDGLAGCLLVDCLPVIPPAQRPVPELGGTNATGSINLFYAVLMGRVQRLRKLLELNAPEVIVRNEQRWLQLVILGLLSERIAGRLRFDPAWHRAVNFAGRLRRLTGPNLLGKHVDYSARAVAVPDPGLAPDQCGLPVAAAVELFRPHLLARLAWSGPPQHRDRAAQLIELLRPRPRGGLDDAWRAGLALDRDLLDDLKDTLPHLLAEVLQGQRLLVSHPEAGLAGRLVALEPVLAAGPVVRLHPRLAGPLGLTFAGESVRLHVLLTEQARVEGEVLLSPPARALAPVAETGQEETIGRDAAGPLDYFRRAQAMRHGRRDDLDRAAKVVDLARRLVAAAQSVVVSEEDCGAGEPRGPHTCRARRGVCRRCWGLGPATGRLVELGTPVGVRAALEVARAARRLESLDRLIDLLEAREPDRAAPLARCWGTVRLGKQGEGWQEVFIDGGRAPRLHLVPAGRALLFAPGQPVRRGQPLADGPLSPHDIVEVRGLAAGRQWLLDGLRAVFHGQQPALDARHLEVIASRLLRRATVRDPGDSDLVVGRVLARAALARVNERLRGRVVVEQAGASRFAVGAIIGQEDFERECARLSEAGLELPRARPARPARARARLDGLTLAARRGSLAAALSVAEARHVLRRAALAAETEEEFDLHGAALRGRLIPAGTGFRRGEA